ncbi:hypothetical protein X797_011348 [Metarhizium robertsii]|uniref:Peptidase T2, asparaginase 2 n=2 Tax=Metarhizium robertsii TaxID=568076 RepID=A0A0B2XD76_METRA|nr:Peptidase T2, asparaginase 2 [Metarhizium robertsii ARSEF 23]EXU95593.1 hypothetical protein X797_011348 [Metarhizium robertsii]KHO10655.1 Peptidase T2, asparaginase 2 [Metarhizium robertsii ARSEF 23]
MKFIAAVLTLAAVATAAPAEVVARTDPTTCSVRGDNTGKVTCCNSAIPIIGQLLCNIAVLGNNCNVDQRSYCCNTSANGGLINVDLLNCVSL